MVRSALALCGLCLGLSVGAGSAHATFPGAAGELIVLGDHRAPPCVVTTTQNCRNVPEADICPDTVFSVDVTTGTSNSLIRLPDSDECPPNVRIDPTGLRLLTTDFSRMRAVAVDALGAGWQRVVTAHPSFEPVWSADGTQVAYNSGRNGGPLRVISLSDQRSRALFPAGWYAEDWSIRGQLLLQRDYNRGPKTGFAVVSARGKVLRRTRVTGNTPRWSPDGRSFVFTKRGAVLIGTPTGTSARRLTDWGGSLSDPAWSPAGDVIVANCGACEPDAVYLLPARPNTPVDTSKLVPSLVNAYAADWQPRTSG